MHIAQCPVKRNVFGMRRFDTIQRMKMFFSSHKSHIFKKSRSKKIEEWLKNHREYPYSVGSLCVACFMYKGVIPAVTIGKTQRARYKR